MNNEPPASLKTAPKADPKANLGHAKGSSKDIGPQFEQEIEQDGINIAHLQRLARLALEPAQAQAARDDLHDIVAMIDAMQTIPTEGVEPLTHPLETPARLRPDRVTEVVDREAFQHTAPATDAGFYLVPKVIE